MSRNRLFTLIAAMVVVMIGLIVIQFTSIRKASQIKEEQFDRSVRNAIDQVIKRMENDETRLARQLARDEMFSAREQSPPRFPAGYQGGVSFSLEFSRPNFFGSYREQLQFYSDTIPHNNGTRDSQRLTTPFNRIQDMSYLRQEMTEARLDESFFVHELLKIQELPLQHRIDSIKLKNMLDESFQSRGINLDYSFAALTSDEGESILVSGDPDLSLIKKGVYPSHLFPNDINEKANWLHVYFPRKSGYILKDTGITVIPLFILTGLLIVIFTYTILIILRQKKLSMIKNDFINNMTHELKTPISTISLASQMLEDGTITNTPKTIEQISKVISQESKRLSLQVEKVLQMAIFNEGRLKLKFKEVHLHSLIENVVENFELKVQNKNGQLLTRLEAEQEEIRGDEVHITNVIFNLLDNAVKYSNGSPKIEIATRNRKNCVVVSVEDNGIGIPKEHFSQIFERFYRVPTGNVHNVKGFGLGLSYVKKIMEVHNAEIKVDSSLNKGTKFNLFFPLNQKQHGTKS